MNWVDRMIGDIQSKGMSTRQFCDTIRGAVHASLEHKVSAEELTPEEAVILCGAMWRHMEENRELTLGQLDLIELYVDEWYEEYASC